MVPVYRNKFYIDKENFILNVQATKKVKTNSGTVIEKLTFEDSKTSDLLRKNNKYKVEENTTKLLLNIMSATHGNPNEVCKFGVKFLNGDKVQKDVNMAFKLFEISSKSGCPEGFFHLSKCYDAGLGTEKSKELSFKFLKIAAENGIVNAQYNLGMSYAIGDGTEINRDEALKWLELSAKNGNIESQLWLIVSFSIGNNINGIEKNLEKSFEFAAMCAENQNLDPEECVKKLFSLYKILADKNNPKAQYIVAICYRLGLGVEKDDIEAIKYFRLSAMQGFDLALIKLGKCLINGIGIKKDVRGAFHCFMLAANQGNIDALTYVGICYEKGIGIQKDFGKAHTSYYNSTFKENNPKGQFYFGKFKIDQGVIGGEVFNGFNLILLSAKQNYPKAIKYLEKYPNIQV